MKSGEREGVLGSGATGMKDIGWNGESWEHSRHQMEASVIDTVGPHPHPHAMGSLLFLCDLLPAGYL